MRIRTQFLLLSLPIVLAPALIFGLWASLSLAGRVPVRPASVMAAQAFLSRLEASTGSLGTFLAALDRADPSLAVLATGRDRTILRSLGEKSLLEGLMAGGAGPSTVWTRGFEIQGYGPARIAVAGLEGKLAKTPPDPLFLTVVAGVFVMMAGGLLIVRSLRSSFTVFEAAAERIRAGDLETPVALPPNPEAERLALSLDSLRSGLKEERARRSRFIMGLSHDLRTPVGLIRGYSEALLDGLPGTEEGRRRFLLIIRDKTAQLDELVENLLDYVRTETDQRREAMPYRDLRIFFAGLAAEFKEDALLNGRQFAYRDSGSGPLEAPLDERLARRAFENLFSNAVRYTQRGGAIDMELETVEGGLAVVSMADDGIGIDPADAPFLFDPLYRGGNVGERKGAGLGLAIVKSVIEGQGWSVSCAPAPGGGARFSVLIPVPGPGVAPST